MNSKASTRPYNAHVLVGNWLEDRVMEEVRLFLISFFFFVRSKSTFRIFFSSTQGSYAGFSQETLQRPISDTETNRSRTNVTIGKFEKQSEFSLRFCFRRV